MGLLEAVIIFHLHLDVTAGFFPSGVVAKLVRIFLIAPVPATYSTHLVLPYFSALMIFTEVCE
jgi:hypothetical protein